MHPFIFTLGVFRFGRKDSEMNNKIKPNENGTFKIDARIQINGKEYRKRETFTGSKRNADRRYSEIVRELEDQAEADQKARAGSLTYFKECIAYYMEQKQPQKQNLPYFNRLLSDLGHCSLEELPDAFDRFMNLLKRSKTRRGEFYSVGTQNRFKTWTNAILNFAYDCGKIDSLPFSRRLKKEKETPRDRSLSPAEITRLFVAIDKFRPYLRPIIQFMLLIPCRKSELLNARRVDLDLRAGVLRIRSGTTKNGKGVNKPIPVEMEEYFRSIPLACPWVFFREENGEYHQLKAIYKAWQFCLKEAGIEDLRIHDTRHFSATELVNSGLSEREVMEVANWDTNMLSTYYNRNGTKTTNNVRAILEAKRLNGTD